MLARVYTLNECTFVGFLTTRQNMRHSRLFCKPLQEKIQIIKLNTLCNPYISFSNPTYNEPNEFTASGSWQLPLMITYCHICLYITHMADKCLCNTHVLLNIYDTATVDTQHACDILPQGFRCSSHAKLYLQMVLVIFLWFGLLFKRLYLVVILIHIKSFNFNILIIIYLIYLT